MIIDCLKRAETYYKLSENLKIGFEWLINNDLNKIQDGKYELENNCYANVQSYLTKDDAPFEAHREYIDIQYMISGEELSGVTDYENCTNTEPYNKDKDIEFLKCNSIPNYFKLSEGEFFIFFPHNAHQPALKIDNNKMVKKVIVKVKV